ncbi:MAG TPA: CorA family divalent cation transporter [Candidatus Absconditabacterales bacterium]|nr:CorA family divalent cation transporter [Candidatus Absconditabacterales bacterium]
MYHQMEITNKKVQRIHMSEPKAEEIEELTNQLDMHEIMLNNLLDFNAEQKVERYKNNLLFVLNIPKHDENSNKYIINQIHIILGKNYIITMIKHKSGNLKGLFDYYQKKIKVGTKHTPVRFLHKILEVIYNNTIKALTNIDKEITAIQNNLVSKKHLNKKIFEDLMTQKLNLIFFKYKFQPQKEILGESQILLEKFFGPDQQKIYINDLESKLDKIIYTTALLYENIESMSDTYNAIVNIEINKLITLLTIYTVILGTINLVAGIYGMNLTLPFSENELAFFFIIGIMIAIGLSIRLLLKKRYTPTIYR